MHDFLLDLRGAERVFAAICELWPDADLFTAVYDERGTEGRFAKRRVHTSFLQATRPSSRTFRAFLPLYPYAIESFDLRAYDLVVSSSSAWSHGVIVDEDAVHVCYCHNPFRYAWNERDATLAGRPALMRAALRVVFNRWRQWDWIAAQRVDSYIANSETTRRRIKRYYGREADVLHPPVEISRFSAGGPIGDYHLMVSELMPHKRIDLAVVAFNRLGLPLVVVGDGPDARRLRRLAGPTIRFEGRVPDARVEELLGGCRALVVTATEEFGIAAVEALAAGRPVIAPAAGGAMETVSHGVTGSLYAAGSAESLADAVRGLDALGIHSQACLDAAACFDASRFRRRLGETVEAALEADRPARPTRRRSPRRAPRLRAPV